MRPIGRAVTSESVQAGAALQMINQQGGADFKRYHQFEVYCQIRVDHQYNRYQLIPMYLDKLVRLLDKLLEIQCNKDELFV